MWPLCSWWIGSEALTTDYRWKALRLPEPVTEYRFHPTRLWRFDYAWPERRIALEVEGGIWSAGRHTRGSGFRRDMDKYNEAGRLGWRVFRYDTDRFKTGEAHQFMKTVLQED